LASLSCGGARFGSTQAPLTSEAFLVPLGVFWVAFWHLWDEQSDVSELSVWLKEITSCKKFGQTFRNGFSLSLSGPLAHSDLFASRAGRFQALCEHGTKTPTLHRLKL
jgi:hypothetical protein